MSRSRQPSRHRAEGAPSPALSYVMTTASTCRPSCSRSSSLTVLPSTDRCACWHRGRGQRKAAVQQRAGSLGQLRDVVPALVRVRYQVPAVQQLEHACCGMQATPIALRLIRTPAHLYSLTMCDSLMLASWNADRNSGSSHTDCGDKRLFFTIVRYQRWPKISVLLQAY